MRGGIAVLGLVCGLSIGLVACEGAAQGPCATAEGVAQKMTALTDDIAKAQGAGKIDNMTAGEIAAKIMAAGTKFTEDGNHRAYCTALDDVRSGAGL